MKEEAEPEEDAGVVGWPHRGSGVVTEVPLE